MVAATTSLPPPPAPAADRLPPPAGSRRRPAPAATAAPRRRPDRRTPNARLGHRAGLNRHGGPLSRFRSTRVLHPNAAHLDRFAIWASMGPDGSGMSAIAMSSALTAVP